MPSFEECLQHILQAKLLSDRDRQIFNRDAQVIRNFLMEQMKASDPEFNAAFDGLSLTGSNLDKLKIDLPDEFDMDMKLKFNFNMTPHEDQNRPSFVIIKADISHYQLNGLELIGKKRKIKRYPLQMWLRSLFFKIIGNDGIKRNVEGRNYLITYPKCGRGSGVAHTVIAKEIGGMKREMSFDFVPAFEFPAEDWPFKKIKYLNEDQPWFAIPFGKTVRSFKEQSNKFTFRICAPHWERDALKDKQNLKNSIRLMKALRDANGWEKLASYTMKSIYLQEIDERSPDFWELPIGDILIEMLECLLSALENGHLPFFLHRGFNQFNLLPRKLMGKYKTEVEVVIQKLKLYRHIDDIELSVVKAIFER